MTTVEEKYEFSQVIGKGSFGTIHLVKRKSDDKQLVAKALQYSDLKEKEKELLVQEVNLLRKLRHPNIVKYYDRYIDWQQSTLYIIMEHCAAGDLGSLIKTCKQDKSYLQEDVIWNIVSQVVGALKHCHCGMPEVVLHRDVKPSNIFLDAQGNVKLGDFGLARVLSPQSEFARTWVGTPFYMSPEQVDGLDYNEKSDVWALGCLTYELSCLRPPFQAPNPLALARLIQQGRFPRIPSHYSSDLSKFIAQMLTTKSSKRPSISNLEQSPHIRLCQREARLKYHYTILKQREEALVEREKKLALRELQVENLLQGRAIQEKPDGDKRVFQVSINKPVASDRLKRRSSLSPAPIVRAASTPHSVDSLDFDKNVLTPTGSPTASLVDRNNKNNTPVLLSASLAE